MPKSSLAGVEASSKALSVPPLSFGEKFEDAYELVFVLDDREQLAAQMSVTSVLNLVCNFLYI